MTSGEGALLVAGSMAVVFYLLPALIASTRGHHNLGAIVVINLLLGWTFIGWVVALAMSAGYVRPREQRPHAPRFDTRTGERLR